MDEMRREAARRLFLQLWDAGVEVESWPGSLLVCPDLVRPLAERHFVIRPAGRLTAEQRAALAEYRNELIDLVANFPFRLPNESAN